MGWNDRDYKRRRGSDDGQDASLPGRDDGEDGDFDGGDDDDYFDADNRGDDPEAPDAADRDDSDDPGFVRCPNCRKMVVEDAEQCPRCGEYIEEEKLAAAGRPTWVWVGIALALLVAVLWAIAR